MFPYAPKDFDLVNGGYCGLRLDDLLCFGDPSSSIELLRRHWSHVGYQRLRSSGGRFPPQAIIGSPSGSTTVRLPNGWNNAQATALNDSGQVVGYGTPPEPSQYQAFIGTTAGSTAIPLPAGGWIGSIGFGVNSSGQVTGGVYSGARNGLGYQAFIGTTAGPPAGVLRTALR
jgi:hypothetical protein